MEGWIYLGALCVAGLILFGAMINACRSDVDFIRIPVICLG